MSRTYPELKIEIARLAAEAERARAYELPDVIAELNVLIERYQLNEAMIFSTIRTKTRASPRL